MQSISELAKQLKPYLGGDNSSGSTRSGASASQTLTQHALSSAYHTGQLASNQAPQFPLLDGSRAYTGTLNINSNNLVNVGLINGIDITDIAGSVAGVINAGDGISISDSGVIASTPTISVDHASLIDSLSGIKLVGTKLRIDYDTSLQISSGVLGLSSNAAGTALAYDAANNQINLDYGDGLSIAIDPGVLTVDVSDFAGDGLVASGNDLDINPGNNLHIVSDTIAVNVSTLAGDGLGVSGFALKINDGDGLQIASDILAVKPTDFAGDGLSVFGGDLKVNTGIGLEINADDVDIDLSYNFAWTGIHTHSANVASAGAVVGTTGWTLLPSGNADFRDIQADSLTVDAFISDVNLALAGSEYITKSGGTLSRDFVSPASTGTLYVYDLLADTQNFEDGDYVALRYMVRSTGLQVGWVYGTVTGYTDLIDGEQSWTFARQTGVSGVTIPAGIWAIDYGSSGDGVIKSTVNDLTSPFTDIQTWTTDPAVGGNFTTHVRLGNLSGITDPYLAPSGYGLYAENVYLRGEMALGDGEVVLDDAGLSLDGTFRASTVINTPEKISWYRDNSDRTTANHIAQIRGYQVSTDTTSSQLVMDVHSGHWEYISTGSDESYIALQSLWYNTNNFASGSSFGRIEIFGAQSASRINMAAKDFNFDAVEETTISGTVVKPKVDVQTDLGSPSKRWNKLYVDEIVAGTTSTTDTGHNHDDRYYLDTEVDSLLSNKSGTNHTHASYATVVYVDAELGDKSDTTHDHLGTHYTEAEVDSLLNTKAAAVHSHGDLYYTEAEVDSFLAGKEDTGHTHNYSTVTDHADLANIGTDDHHAQAHAYDSADHTGTLSWSNVSKTGALLSDFGGTLAWASVNKTGALLSDFGGALAWATIDMTGSDISDISGTLPWASVAKTGSDLADLSSRLHSDLQSVGADDHHSQQHALNGADHTGTLDNAQAPQFPLLDGSRSFTGHLLNDGGFDQDIGSAAAPWRNLHVLELQATRLVSTDVMATMGGRILVSKSGALTRDLADDATTIYIDVGTFENNEYAYLQTTRSGTPRYEAVKFASDATTITVDEEYSYTIVRNEDELAVGTAFGSIKRSQIDNFINIDTGFSTDLFVSENDAWLTGDGIASLGKDIGDGFIDISSNTAINGGDGPTINIYSRSSTAEWNDIANVVALGNLESRLDYTEPKFGLAVGTNLNSQIEAFQGFTATTDGVRLINTPLSYYYSDSGVQKLGAYFGAEGDKPIIKNGPDSSQLFGDAPGGFSGEGFWTGDGTEGYSTYIGNSDTSFLRAANGVISVSGEFQGTGITIDDDGPYVTGSMRFADSNDYSLTIDKYYNANPSVDRQYLRLKTDGADRTGVLLESRTNGVIDQALNISGTVSTLTGALYVERKPFSTRPGVRVFAVDDVAPAFSASDRAEIWGNRSRIGVDLLSNDTAIGTTGTDGKSGPYVEIGRNTNSAKPASGRLTITNADGVVYHIWVDDTGALRFGTSVPTFENDKTGTVIS